MAKTASNRTIRVADQIRMEVGDILVRKIKDPRLRMVTVTDVEVTADLRIARIYVTSMDPAKFDQDTKPGLQRATGFIRTELGRRLNLRYTPEVVFFRDMSPERGDRMERLLNSLPVAHAASGDVMEPGSHGPVKDERGAS